MNKLFSSITISVAILLCLNDHSSVVANSIKNRSLKKGGKKGKKSGWCLITNKKLFSKRGKLDRSGCCPEIYQKNVINLDFNPAFIAFDDFSDGNGLTITSFYNIKLDTSTGRPVFVKPDLVARILRDDVNGTFSEKDMEILTDQQNPSGPPKTNWPNEVKLTPAGDVFPFEAVVLSQGFHAAPFPGRLTAIDMFDLTEYVIQQSQEAPLGNPWYYHSVIFIDMNNDGFKDILTVRSGFRVGRFPNDPSGQLLWFKNPGHANIKPDVEWEERILINKIGPDIYLKVHDFDNDGVVEIVATHFFTGNRITMYGAPDNEDGHGWADVNALDPNAPSVRSADISADQGKPFGFEIVDVNGDGLADILATNHQNDNFPAFPDDMDGRVYVIAQRDRSHSSTDGSNILDIFEDIEKNGVWDTHILLKGIRPQPSMVGARGSRAAPGNVVSFYPNFSLEEEGARPWILVGGDEASKVWILRPSSPYDNNWNYEAHVIFDINDAYDNPEQTQTDLAPEIPSVTISTIGKVATQYDQTGATEIYIPVFGGHKIFVYSFRQQYHQQKPVGCLEDITLIRSRKFSPVDYLMANAVSLVQNYLREIIF